MRLGYMLHPHSVGLICNSRWWRDENPNSACREIYLHGKRREARCHHVFAHLRANLGSLQAYRLRAV